MKNLDRLFQAVDERITRALSRVRGAVLGRLEADQADGAWGKTSVEGLADEHDAVSVLGPYGLRGRAPAGARVVLLTLGAGGRQVGVAVEDGAPPLALAVGEVVVYGSSGAWVRIKENGGIDVFAAEGAPVRIGQGERFAVARVTDSVEVSGSIVISAGSSAGTYPFTATGTITTGSPLVESV